MHEHLDEFGLINMNGRMYDPKLCTFISPDPQMQDPDYWLNHNRYAYCLNNPLKYTDPSGYRRNDHRAINCANENPGFVNRAVTSVRNTVSTVCRAVSSVFSGGSSGSNNSYSPQSSQMWYEEEDCKAFDELMDRIMSTSITSISIPFVAKSINSTKGFGDVQIGYGSPVARAKADLENGTDVTGVESRATGASSTFYYSKYEESGIEISEIDFNGLYDVFQNIPLVKQNAKYNCLPACLEAIDHYYHGTLNQNKIRKKYNRKKKVNCLAEYCGLNNYETFSYYTYRYRHSFQYVDDKSVSLNEIRYRMINGWLCTITINTI